MTRTYRMKVRAERHADTRRRILEAAVHLHRTGDAQRITITEVAKLAGVERPTVLRHFHDRISLLMACTFGDPVPAQHAADWAREPNPEARLALALTEQYAWYRRNRPALQQLEALTDDRLSASREAKQALRNRAYEVLSRGWAVDEADRPRLLMAIRHAFEFWSWFSLAESGIADEDAVTFMVDVVRGVESRWSRSALTGADGG